jgi:hypothetical protein
MSDIAPADPAGKKQRRGRPFERGVSGNPKGRPRGSRNRAGILATALAAISDDDLVAIVTMLVAQAKNGDMSAIRILLDRLVPVPRARAVTLNLPSLADGYGRSKATALAAVLDAVAAGDIDPGEAAIIADLVEKVGDASHNCGGLLPPRPLTKKQRERLKEQQADPWLTLKPWPRLELK